LNNNKHMVILGNGTEVSWDKFSTWSLNKQDSSLNPRRNKWDEKHFAKMKIANVGRRSTKKGIPNLKARKPIMTPFGQFEGIKFAAVGTGLHHTTIRQYLKKRSEEYYYINSEDKPKLGNKKEHAVMTPDGLFPSKAEAARHYNVCSIRYRLEMFPDQYWEVVGAE